MKDGFKIKGDIVNETNGVWTIWWIQNKLS